ncbi:hypothetical protein BCR44DRAFT_1427257 [Catenaria anguillulae PL171]|uniref:Secreted protein n=1 Tax=Catenaria anguillulae PL171 TaxID=765915 RepID=A0A1Y2HWZ3_9FUNG|nr:hypothetical protein BCR44DRAFT_1427257 [Catenaria anguillulae PL171]
MTKPTMLLTAILAELVIIHAIRSVDTIYPDTDAIPIHTLMLVLPPDTSVSATDVTRAALTQLWWITTDLASQTANVRLLDLLFAQRHWRPLVYTAARGLRPAVEQCSLDVVQWWYAKRAERQMWFADVKREWIVDLVGSSSVDRAGVLRMFKWYCEQVVSAAGRNVVHDEALLANAIVCGCKQRDRALLEYLDSVCGSAMELPANQNWTWSAVNAAAANQDLESVEWILSRIGSTGAQACNKRLIQELTRGVFASGSLEMVHWLQTTTLVFPVTGGTRLAGEIDLNDAVNGASIGGHLHLIRWAIQEQNLVKLDPATGKIPRYLTVIVDLDQVVKEMNPGFVAVLEWWTTAGNAARFGIQVTGTMASWTVRQPLLQGNVAFAEWWLVQSSVFHEYTNVEMVADAAVGGNVQMLDLLYHKAGSAFRYHFNEPEIVNLMTEHGQIKALEWWKANVKSPSLMSCFHPMSLAKAGHNGHVDVLDWWKKQYDRLGQPLPLMPPEVLQHPSTMGQLDVLDWWKANVPDAVAQIDRLWQDMSPRVTKWWFKHGKAVRTAGADKSWILHAALHGNPIMLAFAFDANGIGPGIPRDAVHVDLVVRTACAHGHANVLEWLAQHSGLPFTFGTAAVFVAAVAPLLDASWNVIEWWAGRVKEGDKRCMVDMKELERKFQLIPKGVEVWPQLLKYLE